MKCLILVLAVMLGCTSCTALPAEERAFAVVLCVEKDGNAWRVHGRIPTYQTGGGYLTVTGDGNSLPAALADLDAASPMHLHLSQLRLLAVDRALAESGELAVLLNTFSDRPDMRQHCMVAISDVPAKELMDALKPAVGARLSKAVDVMLDARIEQGLILPARLSDVMRMGERQTPVLIALTLKNKSLELSGGYSLTADLRPAVTLSPEETMLLSLLLGKAPKLRLTLGSASAQVRDASVQTRLSEDGQTASVEMTLRATASNVTPEGLEQAMADACAKLLSKLSSEGCDVLGLGRKAILYTHDMAEWHTIDWPGKLARLRWSVSILVSGPA